jgi:hypothetical protein
VGRSDVVSGVFLLAVAVFVSRGAVEISLGSLRAPEAGLYPLILGVLLGALALALVGSGLRAGSTSAAAAPYAHSAWAAIVALAAYAAFLPTAGYPLATVLVLAALFRVGGSSWRVAVGLGLVFGLGTYGLAALLGIGLPRGFLFSGN